MTRASCSNRLANVSSYRNSCGSTFNAIVRSRRTSRASYTAAMPPRPSSRRMTKGPTSAPARRVVEGSSPPSSESCPVERADFRRHEGHNPAEDAPGANAVLQTSHEKPVMFAPMNASWACTASELEADLAGHRSPDDVAEHVLLHRFVQQVGSTDRDGHLAVIRMHAEATVEQCISLGLTVIWGQDVLPVF